MSLHIFLEVAPKCFIKSLICEWILENDLAKFQMSITSKKTSELLKSFFNILNFDAIYCKHKNDQNKINWIINNNLKYSKIIFNINLDCSDINNNLLEYLQIKFKDNVKFESKDFYYQNSHLFQNLKYFSTNLPVVGSKLNFLKMFGKNITTLEISNTNFTYNKIIQMIYLFPNLTFIDVERVINDENKNCCFENILLIKNNLSYLYIKNDTLFDPSVFNNNLEKLYLKNVTINFKIQDLPIILNNLEMLEEIKTLNFGNYISIEDIQNFETIIQHKSIKQILFKVQGNLSEVFETQIVIFKRLLRNPIFSNKFKLKTRSENSKFYIAIVKI